MFEIANTYIICSKTHVLCTLMLVYRYNKIQHLYAYALRKICILRYIEKFNSLNFCKITIA